MRGDRIGKRSAFFVAEDCHPQTIEVVQTRAGAIGIEVRVGDGRELDCEMDGGDVFGILLQYPATDGRVRDYAGDRRARPPGQAPWWWWRPTCWR